MTLLAILAATVVTAQKPGYEIKVTFKPFKNQFIYLGHYFGKTYPIVLDYRGKASIDYGVTGVPETFFISADQKVIKRITGPVTLQELEQFGARL